MNNPEVKVGDYVIFVPCKLTIRDYWGTTALVVNTTNFTIRLVLGLSKNSNERLSLNPKVRTTYEKARFKIITEEQAHNETFAKFIRDTYHA